MKPEQAERVRSSIAFPYIHLEASIDLARMAYTLGEGSSCGWGQLAESLHQAPKGGRFRQKLISARTFGLLEYENGRVSLTPLGKQCIDTDADKKSREQAFLTAPLFSAMFARLEGQTMPAPDRIEHKMAALGVPPKQTSRARQAFMRSARDAGFFDGDLNRMTKPSGDSGPVDSNEGDAVDDETESAGRTRHILIEALLDQMPDPDSKWETTRCLAWLHAFVSSLPIVYTKSDLRAIEVRMRPDRDAS